MLCFFLIALQAVFSQKRTQVWGIVTTEGKASKTISVINYQTKTEVTPKPDGRFEIRAKKDDLLVFMLEGYLDQQITVGDHELKNGITVLLKAQPIELQEVQIGQTPLRAFKISQAELDEIKLLKDAKRPVVQGVYTGETVNGVDFIRMGKGIINFFRKKEADKKPRPTVNFREYLQDNISDGFYTKTLKLQPDQVYAFIDYCNDDPQSKIVVQNNNPMAIIDFLITKSQAFKKLGQSTKK